MSKQKHTNALYKELLPLSLTTKKEEELPQLWKGNWPDISSLGRGRCSLLLERMQL